MSTPDQVPCSRGLYVGILTHGTTSQLRASTLRELLPSTEWTQLDTDIPFLSCPRWARSLAFRLRVGPAIQRINEYAISQLGSSDYDIAWVDKGTCLLPATIRRIRDQSRRLIYYTPDTSFLANQSRFFNRTITLYDLVVTTKSFELAEFQRRIPADRIELVTQSFDHRLHFPRCRFSDKRREVVLVGLCEPNREQVVRALLDAKVPVRLAGKGWAPFCHTHRNCEHLQFSGEGLFGEAYADALSRASIGLGLLTKRFPERHTTRTFEIPACGTALATEGNEETRQIFDSNSAIFFRDVDDLVQSCCDLLNARDRLEQITTAGYTTVMNGRFSNNSVIRRILVQVGVPVPLVDIDSSPDNLNGGHAQ